MSGPADVLVYHQRAGIKGCHCGWAVPGASHPEHLIDVLREAGWVVVRAEDVAHRVEAAKIDLMISDQLGEPRDPWMTALAEGTETEVDYTVPRTPRVLHHGDPCPEAGSRWKDSDVIFDGGDVFTVVEGQRVDYDRFSTGPEGWDYVQSCEGWFPLIEVLS